MKWFFRSLTVILVFISTNAIAQDGAPQDNFALLSKIYLFIYYGAFVSGFFTLFYILYKFFEHSNNPNDKELKFSGAAITIVAASILMNLSLAVSNIMVTATGNSDKSMCFIADQASLNETFNSQLKIDKNINFGTNCYNLNNSEYVSSLLNEVEDENQEKVKNTIKYAIAIFQIIGLVYFIISIRTIININRGIDRQSTYAKAIIMMLTSALIIDFPHTVEFAIESFKSFMGVNS